MFGNGGRATFFRGFRGLHFLVFVAAYLPELGTNLVTALSSLDMNDLSHVVLVGGVLMLSHIHNSSTSTSGFEK